MTAYEFSQPVALSFPDAMTMPPSLLTGMVAEEFGEAEPYVPAAVTALALKAIPECNFRCDGTKNKDGAGYVCYMNYESGEYLKLPEQMEDNEVALTGRQIGEYTKAQDLKRFLIVFHGGEPLLVKDVVAYYNNLIDKLEAAAHGVNPDLGIDYSMHTNASHITLSVLRGLIKKRRISTSCSLDGGEEEHDRNRVTKHGAHGTFKITDRGIRRLSARHEEQCTKDCDDHFSEYFSGLLAVIDLRNDPVKTYEALCAYGAPKVDFLLPYKNHDDPPYVPPGETSPTPYADWLLTVFHCWMNDQKAGKEMGKDVPDIRFFRSIINLARGFPSETEAIGPNTSSILFENSAGQFEQLDALHIISSDQTSTNLDVSQPNAIEKAAKLLKIGRKPVAEVCKPCPVLDICGGGHIESRFSAANGFDNRSVFCADLKKIIEEVVSISNVEFTDTAADELMRVQSPVLKTWPPSNMLARRSLPTLVRDARAEDVEAIVDLHAQTYLENTRHIIPPEIMVPYINEVFVPDKLRYWQSIVQTEAAKSRGRKRALVATLGKKVIGFAYAYSFSAGGVGLSAHFELSENAKYGGGRVLLHEVDSSFGKPEIVSLRSTPGSPQEAFFKRHFETFGANLPNDDIRPPTIRGLPLPQVWMGRIPKGQPRRVAGMYAPDLFSPKPPSSAKRSSNPLRK